MQAGEPRESDVGTAGGPSWSRSPGGGAQSHTRALQGVGSGELGLGAVLAAPKASDPGWRTWPLRVSTCVQEDLASASLSVSRWLQGLDETSRPAECPQQCQRPPW